MSPGDELELWLERLDNVRKTATGWDASCPLPGHKHDDRDRSLTISRGDTTAVVTTCHVFDDHTHEARRDHLGLVTGMQIEATYDYTDENGDLLYQVVRKVGKKFLQRRPDGHGDWIWNIKDTRRVLYRLPKVLAAVRDGVVVYVDEGEKDVHAMERAGCVATCNSGGADKWRDEFANVLAGAHVVVVRDRDKPGHKHALAVVASLRRTAASVRLVEPAQGKDAADHLAAGLGVEEFVEVEIEEPAAAPAKNITTTRKNIIVPAGDLTLPVTRALGAYQAIVDTDPIRATLAVAATTVLDGEPLWLQLVGSPSSGKSEAISMLRDVTHGRIGEVTVAGLLGWTGRGKAGRPSGLLARIGDGRRLVTITDFSTVLADSDRGRRALLFSFLRVLYDGHAYRENNNAPEPLSWDGRLTVVSAVTPQIDAFSAHADALGPRWLYMRMADPNSAQRKRAASLARQHAARKEQLREAARVVAAGAVEAAQARIADVDVNEIDGEWIDDAAIIATLVRSDVPRDGYGAREINGPATREEPPRMAIMLAILFRGLVALGLPTRTARRITLRCALDSTPLARRHVLGTLTSGETLNTSEIARVADLDRKVTRFALEELELLGLVKGARRSTAYDNDEEDDENPRQRRLRRDWTLVGDEGKLAARLIEEVGRNVEYSPPTPPVQGNTVYGSSHPRSAPWGPGSLADAARRAKGGR